MPIKNMGFLKEVNNKLHSGMPKITDEELKKAIPIYKNVVAFFTSIDERRLDLVEDYLRSDLQIMQNYLEARRKDRVNKPRTKL
jgi:hypothetical protein